MTARGRWVRVLTIIGLAAMVIGLVDPLEGSIIILLGSGLLALGAFLSKSRLARFTYLVFGLIAIGVGALFILSAFGGVGGDTGRSWIWLLVVLPYPVGVILGLFNAVRLLIDDLRRGRAGAIVASGS